MAAPAEGFDGIRTVNGAKGKFTGGSSTMTKTIEPLVPGRSRAGKLTGCPVVVGQHDWATAMVWFTAPRNAQLQSDFGASYTTASTDHYTTAKSSALLDHPRMVVGQLGDRHAQV